MKQLTRLIIGLCVPMCIASPTQALTVTPQPQSVTAPALPLIITAYHMAASDVMFVQIFNNSDQVVSLEDVQLRVADLSAAAAPPVPVAILDGWLLPKSYAVIANSTVAGADSSYALSIDDAQRLASIVQRTLQLVSVSSPQIIYDQVTADTLLWKFRKPTAAGNYTASTTTFDSASTTQPLYGGGLYEPPVDVAGLRIVEILANPRSCAPTDKALDCSDYVKLYNPTNISIDLGLYRLRSDSGGAKASVSNIFALSGVLDPGQYTVIYQRASGEAMSLTSTGGQIWLQDAYGAVDFPEYAAYPDASADNKKGQSWALDFSDTAWKWMSPQPLAENYWPPVDTLPPTTLNVVATVSCGPGRERNPDTNRCRTIVTAAVSLTPCKAGQERNAETNRCRSVLAASTTLVPCKPGETRNPDTNRCRKDTSTASTLTPCKTGYERSAETNRCRKVQSAINTASITDIKTNQLTNKRAWWLAGAIIIAALTYALYEWRQDIWLRLRYSRRSS